jgi:hypothetical protein
MAGSESGSEGQRGPALYSYEPAKLAEGMPAGGCHADIVIGRTSCAQGSAFSICSRRFDR